MEIPVEEHPSDLHYIIRILGNLNRREKCVAGVLSCFTVLLFIASWYPLGVQIHALLTLPPDPSFLALATSSRLYNGQCVINIDTGDYGLEPPFLPYEDECQWLGEHYVAVFPCRTSGLKKPEKHYYYLRGEEENTVQCEWRPGDRVKSTKDVLIDKYGPFFILVACFMIMVMSHGIIFAAAAQKTLKDFDECFGCWGWTYMHECEKKKL
jgi:hypothetical protein